MQNVNLYLPELRPKKEWMTAWTAVMLVPGFCVLMMAAFIIDSYELDRFEQSIIVLETQQAAQSQRIAAIKARIPSGLSAKLDREVEELRETLRNRMLVNDVIAGQSLGNDNGYYARLNALAATTPKSISLKHFQFSKGAAFVEIEGETRSPESIAVFIEALKQRDSFNDAGFGALSVLESDKRKSMFQFSLGFESLFVIDSDLVSTNR